MDNPYNSAILNRVETTVTPNGSTYTGMSVGGCPKCKGATLFKSTSLDSNCDTLVVGGGSTDPNAFNVVLISATLSPKQIPVGGTTTLSVSMQNTGAAQAPAGCIVEILANGTVIGETPAIPAIPAGQFYNFNGSLQSTSAGEATICARIKAGYYNTLPQQKCDTITVGGDIPSGDFYIELKSVTMSPNQVNAGEPVNMIIMLENTGTETAPPGWILQIKKNGTLVGESQPAPEVLAGHTVRGDVNFTESVVGTYTFCARIKEGYYNVLPQEKCATLTVGQLTGGIVNVTSIPSEAGVYMDGLYKGVTPISMENVEPGSHSILIRKTGYKDYNKTVTVSVGVVTTVAATLEEEGGDTPVPVPTNIFLLLGLAGIGLLGGIMMTSNKDKYKPKK